MAMLSRPAFGPRAALAYVTLGTLLDVWTGVWYFAFLRTAEQPMTNSAWFWVVGLFLTGLTLILIGLLLGPIGQAARRSELPPSDAVHQEAQIQKTAAAAGVPPAGAGMPVPAAPGQPAAAAS